MSEKPSETKVLETLPDSFRDSLWKLIGTPETHQLQWVSDSGNKHYNFLERSVWLMRLIRAIEVEDTEILKAFKDQVFKDEVNIPEDDKFKVPLEALKAVLEKVGALETLIEWFGRNENDCDEFLWVVSEKLHLSFIQRQAAPENKIKEFHNSGFARSVLINNSRDGAVPETEYWYKGEKSYLVEKWKNKDQFTLECSPLASLNGYQTESSLLKPLQLESGVRSQ